MNDEQMNKDRANVFFKKKIKVHIKKKDGVWYNGMITEVGSNFFFIDDNVDGKQLIFFRELAKPIKEYKMDGEK